MTKDRQPWLSSDLHKHIHTCALVFTCTCALAHTWIYTHISTYARKVSYYIDLWGVVTNPYRFRRCRFFFLSSCVWMSAWLSLCAHVCRMIWRPDVSGLRELELQAGMSCHGVLRNGSGSSAGAVHTPNHRVTSWDHGLRFYSSTWSNLCPITRSATPLRAHSFDALSGNLGSRTSWVPIRNQGGTII